MSNEVKRYAPTSPPSSQNGEELVRYLYQELQSISQYLANFHLWKVVRTAVNYTPKEWDIVLCTAAVTVTLNTGAKDAEEVIIIRANGAVSLAGNINGSTPTSLTADGESVHLKYFKNEADWKYV